MCTIVERSENDLMKSIFAGIALMSVFFPLSAFSDDMGDCKSEKLSASERLEACRRAIRAMTPYPSGTTQIIGAFTGCEFGKKYPLFNGYDLVCQSYGYKYAFQPDVKIIDSSTAIIDGDEYSVSFE
jgi:hypothetical protein